MKWNGKIELTLAAVAIFFTAVGVPNAAAQQVNGTPGSPSATTSQPEQLSAEDKAAAAKILAAAKD